MMNCTVIYTMKNNITPVFFLNHLFQGYLTFIRGKSTLSKNLYCWTNTSPALLTPRSLDVGNVVCYLLSPSTLLLLPSLLPSLSSCLSALTEVCQAGEETQSLSPNKVNR